jgi:hypothetical protein
MFRALQAMLLGVVLTACAFDVGYDGEFDPPRSAGQQGGFGELPAYNEVEIRGLLALANAAELDELDDAAALDARAARNIIEHRAGADAILDTGDDDLFDTFAELDAVKYVGPSALTKLLHYAYAAGYIPTAPGEVGCLIISEYIEGQGNYNKAIELLNCGDGPIQLDSYSVCLVRNAATDCTTTNVLPAAELAAGDVFTVCRTTAGTFNDPIDTIRDNCDTTMAGVMTFNGDDRLLVFQDAEGDGQPGSDDDVLLDSFGDARIAPEGAPWSDLSLRRCDLTPYTSGPEAIFDVASMYTQHARHDATDFGTAPIAGCPSE